MLFLTEIFGLLLLGTLVELGCLNFFDVHELVKELLQVGRFCPFYNVIVVVSL
jgi:hypothetical protein